MATLEPWSCNTLSFDVIEPSETGKTSVFFNALSGNKELWRRSAGDALAGEGRGVPLYNLRGRAGCSTTQSQISVSDIVDVAKVLLGQVKPLQPIHVGLSIGGLFSLQVHLAGSNGRADGIVPLNILRKDGARLEGLTTRLVAPPKPVGSS